MSTLYEIINQTHELAPKIDKGFDPANLTFDGVKIKEGDEVLVNLFADKDPTDPVFFEVEYSEQDGLYINTQMDLCSNPAPMPLQCLNVTCHYPQKTELEKAMETMNSIEQQLYDEKDVLSSELDHYYQARKKVEELEEIKKIIK